MIQVLFAADNAKWVDYAGPLRAALAEAGLDAHVATDIAAEDVDYIVYAPDSAVQDFGPFTRLKAVLNLWAGVENVVGNPTLRVPLTRMADPGLTEGMVEYVTGHVLRHHLGIDRYIGARDAEWTRHIPPLARDRRVGILGLGALGLASAEALVGLRFDVAGWSRSPKSADGIACYSGEDGLTAVLQRSEIVVLLLPHTAGTENVLNAATLAKLPDGAVIINPGRGALIDDDALLAEIDRLGHATLDVFREEPLPPAHPFWAHPKITITPHIAAETRTVSASKVIAENIRRGEAGLPLLHLVDRAAGY